MTTERIVELDVRPYLRKKIEPFQLIMDTVNRLEQNDILILHATFKPTPLLGLMKMKGYANRVEAAAPDHWIAAFAHKKHGKSRLDTIVLESYAAKPEEGLKEKPETSEQQYDPQDDATISAVGAQEMALQKVSAEAEREKVSGRTGTTGNTGTTGIFLDNRGLEPPQPMVRTLKALERCAPGERVMIHNNRVPMFLIEELKTLGYGYEVEKQSDGSAIVTITKT